MNKMRVCRDTLDNFSTDRFFFIEISALETSSDFILMEDNGTTISPVGVVAYLMWQEIPLFFEDIVLDRGILLRNKLYGILRITSSIEAVGMHPLNSIVGEYKATVVERLNRLGMSWRWKAGFKEREIDTMTDLKALRQFFEKKSLGIVW